MKTWWERSNEDNYFCQGEDVSDWLVCIILGTAPYTQDLKRHTEPCRSCWKHNMDDEHLTHEGERLSKAAGGRKILVRKHTLSTCSWRYCFRLRRILMSKYKNCVFFFFFSFKRLHWRNIGYLSKVTHLLHEWLSDWVINLILSSLLVLHSNFYPHRTS